MPGFQSLKGHQGNQTKKDNIQEMATRRCVSKPVFNEDTHVLNATGLYLLYYIDYIYMLLWQKTLPQASQPALPGSSDDHDAG